MEIQSKIGHHLKVIVFFLFFHCCLQAFSHAEGIEAITRPSADVDLSFVQSGKIGQILALEGSTVKAGSIIMRQDDTVEKVQFSILSAKAKDRTKIEIAQAQLDQKAKDYEKMEWAHKRGAVTDWEVEHARLEQKTALLALKLAEFNHHQDKLKLDELSAIMKNLVLVSPIDGVVEENFVENGESVHALAPVMRIVNIEYLYMDVAVPLFKAKELSLQQEVEIKTLDETVLQGSITHIPAVADAAANTLKVRIKVSNPSGRQAGERVTVNFPTLQSQE